MISIRRLKVAGLGILILAVAIIAWQITAANVSQLLIPSPHSVLTALYDGLVTERSYWYNLEITLIESALGFAAALVLGVVVGAIFAFVPILERSCKPYMVAFQTFPKVAIAPLLIAWLGFGVSSKIALAFILPFFTIMLNTTAGLVHIDSDYIDLFKSLRATPFQQLRFMRAKFALRYLFPAINTAVVLAFLGAVTGEIVGSRKGLGYAIVQQQYTGATDAVFSILLLLAIVGLLLYLGIAAIERRALRWTTEDL